MPSVPNSMPRGFASLSPNRKRHFARVVIWSTAAAVLLAELGYLAAQQLA
jgi:hypothetical protein